MKAKSLTRQAAGAEGAPQSGAPYRIVIIRARVLEFAFIRRAILTNRGIGGTNLAVQPIRISNSAGEISKQIL
jgi:hypothetical protein